MQFIIGDGRFWANFGEISRFRHAPTYLIDPSSWRVFHLDYEYEKLQKTFFDVWFSRTSYFNI